MIKLHSIRPQKKNPERYWVVLSVAEGVLITSNTYRADEERFMPAFTMRNRRAVTVAEISLSEYPGIVAMCKAAIKSNIFEASESDYDEVAIPELKESVTKNKELLTKLAEPAKPVADDEGPYGLGPCLSGEEYEALSELNKAIHVLNMNQKRKKYEPRLTDAGVKDAFMDNFPDREDLFFAAQEAIANGTCTKVT